jgi:preprotein translocase subunit YajC
MFFLTLAQQTAAPAPTGPGLGGFLVPLAIVFLLFYFLIQRPNQRDRTKRENLLNSLAKGDHIVTIGGICGKVESVDKNNNRVSVLVDKNVRLTFLRAAIDRIEKPKAGKSKEGETEEAKA